MRRYIIAGTLVGLLIPLLSIVVNETVPLKYNFNFLILCNPAGWLFVFPARLCKTELCSDLFLVIGIIFMGWGIQGGLVGALMFSIKQILKRKHL